MSLAKKISQFDKKYINKVKNKQDRKQMKK